jgi:hypothetical protein
MKTKKSKLGLKKTTIAGLNRDEMKRLYGGLPGPTGCTENCVPGGPISVCTTLDYTCL